MGHTERERKKEEGKTTATTRKKEGKKERKEGRRKETEKCGDAIAAPLQRLKKEKMTCNNQHEYHFFFFFFFFFLLLLFWISIIFFFSPGTKVYLFISYFHLTILFYYCHHYLFIDWLIDLFIYLGLFLSFPAPTKRFDCAYNGLIQPTLIQKKERERERKKRNTDITDEWMNINQSKYKRWFHWIFELLFDRVWSYSFCRRNENPERWKRHSFSCGCCCCCCYCCCCCSSSCSSKRTEKVGAFQRPCHRSPRIDLRCVHFFCLRRRVTAHESTNWVKLSLDQSDSESSRAPSGEHPVELNRVRTFRNSGRQALEPRVQLTPKWRLIDV